ncbi:HepT-like ribonuclease domain-containing protein [Brevibacterium sp. p3-SID960]
MRNRIAYGYLDVDPQVVQRTVANEVPALIRVINRELGR